MNCAARPVLSPTCLLVLSAGLGRLPQRGGLSRQQGCQGRRRRRRIVVQPSLAAGAGGSGATAGIEQQHPTLLDWLVRGHEASPACLKVERRYISNSVGYSLVATADLEPEEVILSVPLTAAITSEGMDESRWSTHMAINLLDRQRQAAAAAAAGGDPATFAASAQPWLEALPAHIDLPWLFWSEEEMVELQEEDTVAEARQLRAVYEDACQELEGRYTRQQVAWALSLVHSRSFVMEGCHVWVPGIDMCNHALANNASIRCVHSPGCCQGASALEEVCPPDTAAAYRLEPSQFELVAGKQGIAAGEEVTISYGSWPSDVFLLFFGFVPFSNPNDSAVLFYDLFELASFKQRLVEPEAEETEEAWEQMSAAVQQLEAQLGPQEQFFRMTATAAGIDARLLDAAQALLLAGRGSSSGQPMSLPDFLRQRCQRLLMGYPTSPEEDEQLLWQLEDGAGVGPAPSPDVQLERLATAVRYRLGKKHVLHATLVGLPR